MIRDRSVCTNLDREDTVVLYPTFGHLEKDGQTWRIHVSGTVYEAGSISFRKQLLMRVLQRVVKVQPEGSEHETFQLRIREFVAPTSRGKRLALMIGNEVHPLRKATRRNGSFWGILRLPAESVARLHTQGELQQGWLDLNVANQIGECCEFAGRARLIDPQGVSIISDIDDTVKRTDVHCRRSLLANTFLREFQAIEGMAELYREWSAQDAMFHYVSSSPWQLYRPLSEMFSASGFPPGTFHLRSFRLHHHMLRRLLLIRRRGKTAAMHALLRAFPQRRFILVGDSGEFDPEIYAGLARRYPGQIASIYIRELEPRPMSAERCYKLLSRLQVDHFRVFRDPAELPRTPAALSTGQTV